MGHWIKSFLGKYKDIILVDKEELIKKMNELPVVSRETVNKAITEIKTISPVEICEEYDKNGDGEITIDANLPIEAEMRRAVEEHQEADAGLSRKIGMYREGDDVVIFQIGHEDRYVRATVNALTMFLNELIRSGSEQSPDRTSETVYDLTDEATHTHTSASPLSSASCKPSDSE